MNNCNNSLLPSRLLSPEEMTGKLRMALYMLCEGTTLSEEFHVGKGLLQILLSEGFRRYKSICDGSGKILEHAPNILRRCFQLFDKVNTYTFKQSFTRTTITNHSTSKTRVSEVILTPLQPLYYQKSYEIQ